MLLERIQIETPKASHLRLIKTDRTGSVPEEKKDIAPVEVRMISPHEAVNFLDEIDCRLDELDRINAQKKNGPLSLLLCNLESFCLGVEVDQKIKALQNQYRANKIQIVK